jgi:hypothetical protein
MKVVCKRKNRNMQLITNQPLGKDGLNNILQVVYVPGEITSPFGVISFQRTSFKRKK